MIKTYFELLIIPFVSRRELNLRQKLSLIVSFLNHLKAKESEIGNNVFGKYTLTDGKAVNCDPDDCINLDQIINKHHLWKGYIVVKEKDLEKLIQRIGSFRGENFGISWTFDAERTPNYKELFNCREIDLNSLNESSTIKSINFGNFINGNRFVVHFKSEGQSLIHDIDVDLDHFRKKLNVKFAVAVDEINEYKLEYDYGSIKEITISQVSDTLVDIYLHLSHPPKIFINKIKVQGKFYWTRWFNCGIISQDVIGKTKVLGLRIDICNKNSDSSYISVLESLYIHNGKQNTISFAPIDEIAVNSAHHSVNSNLPFNISYALDCIRSQSYIFQDDLGNNHNGLEKFNSLVQTLINKGKNDQIAETLYRLADEYKTGQVYDAYHRFWQIFEKVDKNFELIDYQNKNNCLKYIRDAVITPTRVVFHPPSPCQTSFFLAIAEADYVLRVTIRDEDQKSTLRNAKKNDEGKYEEIFWKKFVKDRLVKHGGLPVGNRLYQLYGSSVSQFKEGGLVLYAKDSLDRTADSLRSSFGIVNEKTVPKYIARIGLGLSKLMSLIDLPITTEFFISPDVYAGSHPSSKQPYNFTDGCGFISSSLASYLHNKLLEQKLIKDESETTPLSAFQVRLMGSKGMLVVDRNLPGNSIVLRESMVKLISKKGDIGIIKVNEPRMAYLNRPFITILNQIGLDNQFFLDLLSDTLDDLYKCLYDNSVAISTLEKYSAISRFIDIKSLTRAGFKLNNDPFFSQTLHSVYNSALELIKSKARIPLPMDKARTMFGVTDPTVKYPKYRLEFDGNDNVRIPKMNRATNCLASGELRSGEVFVWPSHLPEPLKGELIVAKFPVSDPGDIRKLTAVDRSQLHHIRDCIVFPVDGSRPHPDEMSGSDLDGDEYCVIWLEDFKRINIHSPMDYSSSACSSTCDEITDEKQIDFFIQYYQTCAIGLLANAHLVCADKDGIHSEKCKQLSMKNAGALDVAKQGIDDKYSYQEEDKYKEAPSFMEKDEISPTYYSNRALEDICTTTSLVQLIPQSFETSFLIDMNLIHPNWRKFRKAAEEAHAEYEVIRDDLQRQFSCSSENELFTQINSKSTDNTDTIVTIVREVLIKRINKYFLSHKESIDDKLARASAFYMVTRKKVETHEYCALPFIGDCAKYLVKLLENNNIETPNDQTAKEANSGQTLDKKVGEIVSRTIEKLNLWISSFPCRGNKRLQFETGLLIDSVNLFCLGKLRKSQMKLGQFASYLLKNNSLDNGIFSLPSGSNQLLIKIVTALLKHESFMCKNQSFKSKGFLVKPSNRVASLLETLKQMIKPAQILKSGRLVNNCIPVTIYGSPAAILVASIVIRVHNRLTPINRCVEQFNRQFRGPMRKNYKHR